MKRTVFVIISLCLAVCALAACTAGIPTFSALPSAGGAFAPLVPSPTPKPRVIAVYGAANAVDFLEGIQTSAKDSGIEVVVVPGGVRALSAYAQEEITCAIVYLSGQTPLPHADIPVYAYAAKGQSVAGGVPYLGYDGASEAQIALESAIAYPPHLAPVRMIGLFTSQTSEAYTAFSNAKSAGQVFAKMEYFSDAPEPALADWLNDAFSKYYPGMLDAVYAETGELALAAADALASLNRDDIEVFCAGDRTQVKGKLSAILVCTVGPNEKEAGARCFAQASSLLNGDAAESGILLPEALWYSPKL